MLQIGLIREDRMPADSRVVLNPQQSRWIMENYPIKISVQSSLKRAFTDDEYLALDIPVVEDVSHCDILMGIKEVPLSNLIPNKTYFFFSHTIKGQERNRELLRNILTKNISLVDYEALKDEDGRRVLAFGYFAGIVGAHNAIWTYLKRNGLLNLKRMYDYFDYEDAKKTYADLHLPPIKIALTGTGRVGTGAVKVLEDMGIMRVTSSDFLEKKYETAVYCQLTSGDYIREKSGITFVKKDFYAHPSKYESTFSRYLSEADILINGIYWDKNAPKLFSIADMVATSFKTKVIADVTCDIAPNSSIPSTLRACTIDKPVYGYDPIHNKEVIAFDPKYIDVMAIYNLPSELSRDASVFFGEQLISSVLPEILKEESEMIKNATIAQSGVLGTKYQYLKEFVEG